MTKICDRHTGQLLFEIPGDSLEGLDFRQHDLRYADLSGKNLTRCIFDDMNLEEIELSDSILEEASFQRVRLIEAILTGVKGRKIKFNGSRLCMTTLAKAVMPEADFSDSVFEGIVNFTDAALPRAKFRNIKELGGVILWNTDLSECDFEGTDLTQVKVSDIVGVKLRGTKYEYLAEVKQDE